MVMLGEGVKGLHGRARACMMYAIGNGCVCPGLHRWHCSCWVHAHGFDHCTALERCSSHDSNLNHFGNWCDVLNVFVWRNCELWFDEGVVFYRMLPPML